MKYYTHNTTILLRVWTMSGSTRVSRYQKGKTKKVKTNLNLLEQEVLGIQNELLQLLQPFYSPLDFV